MNQQLTEDNGTSVVAKLANGLKSRIDAMDRYTVACVATLKGAFRPDPELTGVKRSASRFVNLWSSGGMVGKCALVWGCVCVLLALVVALSLRRDSSLALSLETESESSTTQELESPRMREPDDILRDLRR